MLSFYSKVFLAQKCQAPLKLVNNSNILNFTQCLKQFQILHGKSFSNYLKPNSNLFIESTLKRNLNGLGKRSIFNSSKNQAIPPIVWLIVKPISKLSAALFGR